MTRRIAIPSTGELLDAHFGRAQFFTVFEIENKVARQVEMLRTSGFEHQHSGLASLLKRNGIEVLVCGGIGGGMIDSLKQAGLELITGASGNTIEVAQSFAQGTLVSTGSVCEEHAHHH